MPSTAVLNPHHHLHYRQEGQLQVTTLIMHRTKHAHTHNTCQVRQDGSPITPGAPVLPPDCYNESASAAQPSPPPPQRLSAAAPPPHDAKQVTTISPDQNTRQVTPKPAKPPSKGASAKVCPFKKNSNAI